ncbi:hypothetical protein [Microbacterium sp.]|uniref:hypothetical protein n=1 Tax=Microbacterium sp. TaxID=51671 RepID=UPI0039E3B1DA
MEMNDPQVWTLIGVFAAAVLGGMSLMTSQFSRVIRAEISGIEGRMGGLEGRMVGMEASLSTKIDALDEKLTLKIETLDERLTSRLDTLDRRVDDLDKEVANLATKFWRNS